MLALEIIIIWLAIVLVSLLTVAYLARRWGHDPFGWMLFAAAIGPFAVIALVGTRHRDRDTARVAEPPLTRASGRRRVVAASDGSEASTRIGAYVAKTYPDAEVVIVTVDSHEAKPRTASEQPAHDAKIEERTRLMRQAIERAGGRSRVLSVFGNAGEEIVRAGANEGAEAIAVGRRGAGLTRAVLGSVSDYVVKNSDLPVIIVS